MTDKQQLPEGMTSDHFEYLDELRDSGRTNMYGAARYLVDEMEVPEAKSHKYVIHWLETFEARQK
jgi:hypothetical protein